MKTLTIKPLIQYCFCRNMIGSIRAFITVNGPFSGFILIFVVSEGMTLTALLGTTEPLEYVFAGLFVFVTIIGMLGFLRALPSYVKTDGFTKGGSQDETNIVKDKINEAEELSKKMEGRNN